MSYEKKTWETGDVIAATDLNNIEDQVAASDAAIEKQKNGLVVTLPCFNTVQAGDFLTPDSSYGTSTAAYGDIFFGRALSVDSENHTAEVQIGGYYQNVGYTGTLTPGYVPDATAQANKIKISTGATDDKTAIIVTQVDAENHLADFILLNNYTMHTT